MAMIHAGSSIRGLSCPDSKKVIHRQHPSSRRSPFFSVVGFVFSHPPHMPACFERAMRRPVLLLLLLLVAAGGSAASVSADAERMRPVVLMHGVTTSAAHMAPVVQWIQEALPGTFVLNCEIGNGALDSVFWPMWKQIDALHEEVNKHPELKDGFNLIGFSQGGLIARGFIERFNSPPVHNFLSWASPQGGQFGTPTFNVKLVDKLLATVPYDDFVQKSIAPSNYWKDPYNLTAYVEKAALLPFLNNEREHEHSALFKKNLSSLNLLLLIYSTVDKTIVPRESGWFSFYAEGTQSKVVPLQEQALYKDDRIGLRSLDEAGRLVFRNTDCTHSDHPTESCKEYFDLHTLPFLNNTLPVA